MFHRVDQDFIGKSRALLFDSPIDTIFQTMPLKIIIAPDKFKGCLTSLEAAEAIERGLRRVSSDVRVLIVPMADGGEGLVETLVDLLGGRIEVAEVTGPLGTKVVGRYAHLARSRTAVMEMASASGLMLVASDQRNPAITTTYGTGELLLRAIEGPIQEVILGIGGSATNDGGAGLAQALGYRLLDVFGEEIPFGGGALDRLDRIDPSGRAKILDQVTVKVACDVANPLCGKRGASAVYGPQKGADPSMVKFLDHNLAHFARIIKRDLGVEVADVPGAGAAGGLGAGLMAFANATLVSGVDLVAESVGLDGKLGGADLCFTGEGRIDSSSVNGKTTAGVARHAKTLGVPVFAICGSIGAGADAMLAEGIEGYFSICTGPTTLENAMELAAHLLEKSAEQVFRAYLTGRKSGCRG